MLRTTIQRFPELTLDQIYAVLQLRSEVFVVEQNCVYQDIDAKDQKALHILGYKNAVLVAYTRIFAAGDYFKEASIGRVVVRSSERHHGFGKEIMNASIKAITDHFKADTICISAQTYLKRFYNDLGFRETGEEYLEDGIPHTAMLRKNKGRYCGLSSYL